MILQLGGLSLWRIDWHSAEKEDQSRGRYGRKSEATDSSSCGSRTAWPSCTLEDSAFLVSHSFTAIEDSIPVLSVWKDAFISVPIGHYKIHWLCFKIALFLGKMFRDCWISLAILKSSILCCFENLESQKRFKIGFKIGVNNKFQDSLLRLCFKIEC